MLKEILTQDQNSRAEIVSLLEHQDPRQNYPKQPLRTLGLWKDQGPLAEWGEYFWSNSLTQVILADKQNCQRETFRKFFLGTQNITKTLSLLLDESTSDPWALGSWLKTILSLSLFFPASSPSYAPSPHAFHGHSGLGLWADWSFCKTGSSYSNQILASNGFPGDLHQLESSILGSQGSQGKQLWSKSYGETLCHCLVG